jgi:single-strand DNA-binding protein
MKSITIAGNIGKDAVTRTTGNGDKVTGFTVAVEDRQGKEKSTLWFDVAIWGARGEKLAEYLTKGGKVVVSGDLSTREHEGKTYLSVRADQVTLLGGKRDDDGQREEREPQRGSAPAGGKGNDPYDTDAIPFEMPWK